MRTKGLAAKTRNERNGMCVLVGKASYVRSMIFALRSDIKAAVNSKDLRIVNQAIQQAVDFGLPSQDLLEAQKHKSAMDEMLQPLKSSPWSSKVQVRFGSNISCLANPCYLSMSSALTLHDFACVLFRC